MSSGKEQKQLRELFCELVAPFILPGRGESLRARVTHREGRKFERFISHGALSEIFSLREVAQQPPAETPCLYGLCRWEKSCWAAAEKACAWGGSAVVITLDGCLLAIQQENGNLRLYRPAPQPHWQTDRLVQP